MHYCHRMMIWWVLTLTLNSEWVGGSNVLYYLLMSSDNLPPLVFGQMLVFISNIWQNKGTPSKYFITLVYLKWIIFIIKIISCVFNNIRSMLNAYYVSPHDGCPIQTLIIDQTKCPCSGFWPNSGHLPPFKLIWSIPNIHEYTIFYWCGIEM